MARTISVQPLASSLTLLSLFLSLSLSLSLSSALSLNLSSLSVSTSSSTSATLTTPLSHVSRHVVFPSFTASGCGSLPVLVCNVAPTSGHTTSGRVYFSPTWAPRRDGNGNSCFVRIQASVSGLTQSSSHGFHIHTYGDLSDTSGKSTGGHFTNPKGDALPHGMPTDSNRHWGDLGNLDADATGLAVYDRVDDVIRLGGVLGRAITIHADSDKGADEQPTGAAGSRIGFCVIGYSNPDVSV